MRAHVRATAAFLVPALALAPSCTSPRREMRLGLEIGETIVLPPSSGGQPIEIPEAELWGSFKSAVHHLPVRADPLAVAEETFGVVERSGTFRYYARSNRLVPETGVLASDASADELTRGYEDWCRETRFGGGDCLHLLVHTNSLSSHGRYVVTLVMATMASFGPMLDSLQGLADPNAVAVMLASAVAMYLLLWLLPEPISKLVSLSITAGLIGYLGLDAFWSLVYGWRALSDAVDVAKDVDQLHAAARDFGRVLGPRMGQVLLLLISHSLGKGLAGTPRFSQATAQAQRLLGVGEVAAVRSITLGAGVITLSVATGAIVSLTPPTSESGPGLAARFEATGDRHELLKRLLTADGKIRTTEKVARQLARARSDIPSQAILEAISSGTRIPDPQGVAGFFMYRVPAALNGSAGTLEVLVDETTARVSHVLFRSGIP